MGIPEEKLLAWQGFHSWLHEAWNSDLGGTASAKPLTPPPAQLEALTRSGLAIQAAQHAQQLLLDQFSSRDLQHFWATVQQLSTMPLVHPGTLADNPSPCTAQQQQEVLAALTSLRDACQALWCVVQRHTDMLQRLCVALYACNTWPPHLASRPTPHSASQHTHSADDDQPPAAAGGGSISFSVPGSALEAADSGVHTSSFSFPSLPGPPLPTPAPPPHPAGHPTAPTLTPHPASDHLGSWQSTSGGAGQQAGTGRCPTASAAAAPVSALHLYLAVSQYQVAVTVCIMRAATCSLSGTLSTLFSSCLMCLHQPDDAEADQGTSAALTPGAGGTGAPRLTHPMSSHDTSEQPSDACFRPPLRHLPPLHHVFHNQSHAAAAAAAARVPPGDEVTPVVTRRGSGQENQPPLDCGAIKSVSGSPGGDGAGGGALPAVLMQLSSLLQLLGLWPACQEAATNSLDSVVHHKCSSLTQGLDCEVLPEAWQWVDGVALRFLHLLLLGQQSGASQAQAGGRQPGSATSATNPAALAADLQVWRQKLVLLVYQSVGELRLQQMWDAVVDHPESLPAVKDMAACLAHTSMQARFVTCFRRVVCRRLLHAGASAQDVVHTYVAIIRVMQALDPAGSLLQAVAGPVRTYLQSRPDTVRCIVERVTGASLASGPDAAATSPSLLEEVQQARWAEEQQAEAASAGPGGTSCSCPGGGCTEAAVLALLSNQAAGGSSQCDDAAFSSGSSPSAGLPASLLGQAVHAPTTSGGTASSSEVVDLLVRVFRSREHFISEYRSCLARDLLRLPTYDTTRALQTCELLKLRFGDACMHACEVMLKDIADSKRLHTVCAGLAAAAAGLCSGQAPALVPPPHWLSAIISSYLFWPQMGGWGDAAAAQAGAGAGLAGGSTAHDKDAEAGLLLPEQVTAGLQAYSGVFHAAKAPRKLHWKPHLGLVELQVEVDGVVVHAHVAPLLATLLLQFQDQSSLSVQQLSTKVGLPVALVRRRVLFWVEAGLLVETAAEEVGESSAAEATPGAGAGGGLWYRRVTCLPADRHNTLITDLATLDEGCVLAGAAASSVVEEMAPFEPYLMGILLNTGGLPLDRLHNMLQRFVVSPKYDKSVDQLAAFLSVLMADGKLVLAAGVYKRKPAATKPADN